jgi:hypothetical protein
MTKAFRIAAATMALGTSIAIAPGLAQANKKPKHPNHKHAAPTAKNPHSTKYIFRGVVVATPAVGATSVQVQIRSGNKAGVTLLGANPTVQTFQIGAGSAAFSWNAAGTAATPAALTSLLAGDPVAVTVWAPKNATLTQLIATPATRVDDYLFSTKPHGRLFIFYGNAVSVDTTAHTVTLNISKMNWRAAYAIRTAGASTTETFSYDPTKTVFLHWSKNKPHLIGPDKIAAGDPLTIKVFSPTYDSKLSTLLTLPAWRVNDHESMTAVKAAIAGANGHTL